MGVVSGIVLFAVIWFMMFLVILPIRVQTQGDAGDVVPGTHAGAPQQHHLRKKALWTTALSILVWAVVATIILSGWITVDALERLLAPSRVVTDGTGG